MFALSITSAVGSQRVFGVNLCHNSSSSYQSTLGCSLAVKSLGRMNLWGYLSILPNLKGKRICDEVQRLKRPDPDIDLQRLRSELATRFVVLPPRMTLQRRRAGFL